MVICSNLLAFRIAQKRFKARIPDLEEGETARMSLTYMKGTLGVLLIFQTLGCLTAFDDFFETSRAKAQEFLVFNAMIHDLKNTQCMSFSIVCFSYASPPKKRPIGPNWNWRHFHQYHLEFPWFFFAGVHLLASSFPCASREHFFQNPLLVLSTSMWPSVYGIFTNSWIPGPFWRNLPCLKG